MVKPTPTSRSLESIADFTEVLKRSASKSNHKKRSQQQDPSPQYREQQPRQIPRQQQHQNQSRKHQHQQHHQQQHQHNHQQNSRQQQPRQQQPRQQQPRQQQPRQQQHHHQQQQQQQPRAHQLRQRQPRQQENQHQQQQLNQQRHQQQQQPWQQQRQPNQRQPQHSHQHQHQHQHQDQQQLRQQYQQQQQHQQQQKNHQQKHQRLEERVSTSEEFPALPSMSSGAPKNAWTRQLPQKAAGKSYHVASHSITTNPTRILTRDDSTDSPSISSMNVAAPAVIKSSTFSNHAKGLISKPSNKPSNNKRPVSATHTHTCTSKSKTSSNSTTNTDSNPKKDQHHNNNWSGTIQQMSAKKKKKMHNEIDNSNTIFNSVDNKDKQSHNKSKTIALSIQPKRKKTTAGANTSESKAINSNMLMANMLMAPPNHKSLANNTIHLDNMLPMGNTVLRGRQKLRPRKKKLTSLKKRVLMERLDQWRHSEANKDARNTASTLKATTEVNHLGGSELDNYNDNGTVLCLQGFVNPEELEDPDEYDEIVADLTNMANKIFVGGESNTGGNSTVTTTKIPSESVYIPRTSGPIGWAFLKFGKHNDAVAAMNCWNDLVIGGNRLIVGLLSPMLMKENENNQTANEVKYLDWKEVIKHMPSTTLVSSLTQSRDEGSLVVIPVGEQTHDKNVSASTVASVGATSDKLWNVYLCNVLTEDDYEDEECLEETREDIKILAQKYGLVHEIRIDGVDDKTEDCSDNTDADFKKREVCISYGSEDIATQAIRELNSMTIGGVPIVAASVTQHAVISSSASGTKDESTMVLFNILTEDDFEDEECQEETKADILKFSGKYGHILNIKLQVEGDKKGEVVIQYDGLKTASIAAKELNGMLIGGQPMVAREADHDSARGSSACDVTSRLTGSAKSLPPICHSNNESFMILENILTEDDFEDEECRGETMVDITDLVEKYGSIADLKIMLEGDNKGQILVQFIDDNTEENLSTALNELNGMVIGGQQIVARRQGQAKSTIVPTNNLSITAPSVTVHAISNSDIIPDDPKPMFSGGKKIPEQYAKCKRVPKIPTPPIPREYASKIGDAAIPLLVNMLGELMRLQKRSKDDKNAKLRRRLVMGLREVARGIRARKVKMVVMANNLDMYGAIDSKLQEILDLAREEDVPVFFELNKRKLGKALGKSIKVAVVGIQSSDGAHDPFKQLKKLAYG